MKAFVPVLLFSAITFVMLGLWNEFSGAALDLRPWLYLVRAVSWLIALLIASLFFARSLLRGRLRTRGSALFATVAILIYYPCDGFFTAHAEERVIQKRRATEPASDMGYSYMYGEFSGSGYSRGAMDAIPAIYTGLQNALVCSFIWVPIIFVLAHRLYRRAPQTSIDQGSRHQATPLIGPK